MQTAGGGEGAGAIGSHTLSDQWQGIVQRQSRRRPALFGALLHALSKLVRLGSEKTHLPLALWTLGEFQCVEEVHCWAGSSSSGRSSCRSSSTLSAESTSTLLSLKVSASQVPDSVLQWLAHDVRSGATDHRLTVSSGRMDIPMGEDVMVSSCTPRSA